MRVYPRRPGGPPSAGTEPDVQLNSRDRGSGSGTGPPVDDDGPAPRSVPPQAAASPPDAGARPPGLGTLAPFARLACPRCEHDLRTAPLAWRTDCPLEGTCTECGLRFAWADLLSRGRAYPRWAVEGAAGGLDWIRRWPATQGLALLRPGLVHRRLRMEHHRRLGRLALTLVPLLLLAIAVPTVETARATAAAGFPVRLIVRDAVMPWRTSPSTVTRTIDQATTARRGWFLRHGPGGGVRVAEIDQGVLRRQPVVTIADLERGPGPVGRVRLLRVRRAAGADVGVLTTPRGRVSPALIAALRRPPNVVVSGPVPWDATAPWLARLGTYGGPLVAVPVLTAASFALLPVVRRRAKVTPGHVVRLMLYGLLLAAPLALALSALADARGWPVGRWVLVDPRGRDGVDARLLVRIVIPAVVLAAATFLWTRSAATVHLRLARPMAVATSVTAVGVLATTVLWTLATVAG